MRFWKMPFIPSSVSPLDIINDTKCRLLHSLPSSSTLPNPSLPHSNESAFYSPIYVPCPIAVAALKGEYKTPKSRERRWLWLKPSHSTAAAARRPEWGMNRLNRYGSHTLIEENSYRFGNFNTILQLLEKNFAFKYDSCANQTRH